MSFHTGLVSISFRPHSVDEILNACRLAGLEWLEWGSDVHVPAGDAATAQSVAEKTRQAGMRCITYGSYFRLGHTPMAEFPAYVDSACRLGARNIRLWCGTKGSREMSAEMRAAVVADGKMAAQQAQDAGLVVVLECHSGTLTDEYHSALDYLDAVDHPAMRMYWQPSQFHSLAYNLEAARALAPYTECLHVFQWDASQRYPLSCGEEVWAQYLDIFREQPRKIGLLLEFMHDDRLDSLLPTAKTLQAWL